MEAEEVTVVVHSARNIQGRKPDRNKFSVIFGLSNNILKQKYRTSVVKSSSGSPVWNEESAIPVRSQKDQVFFTVTEKDDVLGHISMPVTVLSCLRGQVHSIALRSHKKCPNPQGDLVFQAYISKQSSVPEIINPNIRRGSIDGGNGVPRQWFFSRFRHTISFNMPHNAQKPNSSSSVVKDSPHKKRSNLMSINKMLSRSLHDLFHSVKSVDAEVDTIKTPTVDEIGSMNHLDKMNHPPDVASIIPNLASVCGNTPLCIEGKNLGLSKFDIIEFTLCGSDLVDTIEFESESRIYVTTKQNTPAMGDLWIETISGGQNVFKNMFTFVEIKEDGEAFAQQSPSIAAPLSPAMGSYKSNSPPYSPRRAQFIFGTAKVDVIEENCLIKTVNDVEPSKSVKRSLSQNQDDMVPLSQSHLSTLLRVKSTNDLEVNKQLAASPGDAQPRFRKNNWKRVTEAVPSVDQEAEGASEKAKLQQEIVALMKENEVFHALDYLECLVVCLGLRKENSDMNQYIETIVARVMESCPEVLTAMPHRT